MADGGHHGEGEHDERHMPMPSVPGACFIMVEAQFVLGRLEAVLDRPAVALDTDKSFDGGCGWRPCRKESQIAVGNVLPDPKAARPEDGTAVVIVRGFKIGQFQIGPVIEAGALCPFTPRQALPFGGWQLFRNRSGGSRNAPRFAP